MTSVVRLWLGLGLVSLLVEVGCVITLLLDNTRWEVMKWMSAALVISVLSGIGLAGHLISRRGRCVRLCRVSLGAAIAAAVLIELGILGASDVVPPRAMGSIVLVIVACGAVSVGTLIAANLFRLEGLSAGVHWLRCGVVGAMAVSGGVLVLVAAFEINGVSMERFQVGAFTMAAVLLVSLAGSPLVTTLHRRDVHRRRTLDSAVASAPVKLCCPKCRKLNTMKPGRGWCVGCGCEMVLEVEEPRCACGYLVFRLSGETCPECGREIPEALRISEEA